jgi:hypothetical protein
VEGEGVEESQRKEGSGVVCWRRVGACSFCRVARCCGGHRRVGGGDGAIEGEEHGRGQGTVQRGLAVLLRVMAQ